MKRGVFAAILVCLLLVVVSSQAMAAYEFYMQIRGVPGESVEPKHPGWISVLSWGSYPLPMPTTQSGGAGPGLFSVKHYGGTKISPLLLNLLLMNTAFDMKFDIVEGTRTLHYTLSGCRLTSYTATRTTNPRPIEELTFVFNSRRWSWGT
jgi:type VI protein secretion system component Hcp